MWKICAATVAPVPQAWVMPAPRSHTRTRISLSPETVTKWTLIPPSKWASMAGPATARSTSEGSSTSHTMWGLPMSPVSHRFTMRTGAPTASIRSSMSGSGPGHTTPMSTVATTVRGSSVAITAQ